MYVYLVSWHGSSAGYDVWAKSEAVFDSRESAEAFVAEQTIQGDEWNGWEIEELPFHSKLKEVC